MEPIVSIIKPTSFIGIISVFAASYDNLGILQFPVLIDEVKLTFHLDEDACWVYLETIQIPEEVRQIIGDLIEKHFA